MFKKAILSAILLCAATAASAGPIKPGETAGDPLLVNLSTVLDAKWTSDGSGLWQDTTLTPQKYDYLYIKVAADTVFDFGILAPNNGSPQAFDFRFTLLNLSTNTSQVYNDVTPKYMNYAAYWDNVTLLANTVYRFDLDGINIHANANNIDFKFMAGNTNEAPNPGSEVPEPASLGLLGLGLLGLAAMRRRKQ